eukprot:1985228-Amphidinium_carterae.2
MILASMRVLLCAGCSAMVRAGISDASASVQCQCGPLQRLSRLTEEPALRAAQGIAELLTETSRIADEPT